MLNKLNKQTKILIRRYIIIKMAKVKHRESFEDNKTTSYIQKTTTTLSADFLAATLQDRSDGSTSLE